MQAELAEYQQSIADRLRRICDALDGLDAAQLNRRAAPGANSAWVLAQHTLGNARAWVLGIAAGAPRRRDRPGEFASSGSDLAALRADVERFIIEMREALASLPDDALDRRLVPAKELWGDSEPHEISVRRALIQVIEHASLHLGHLQLTRDLLTEDGAS